MYGDITNRRSVIRVGPQVLPVSMQSKHGSDDVVGRKSYPDRVLSSGPNPRRLSEIESHIRSFVQDIKLQATS